MKIKDTLENKFAYVSLAIRALTIEIFKQIINSVQTLMSRHFAGQVPMGWM